MAYSEFGKILRKILIDNNIKIFDFARLLDVSSSFVSSVICGKKNVPDTWIPFIVDHFKLSTKEKEELEEAEQKSRTSLKFDLLGCNDEQRNVEIQFQRSLEKLTPKEIEELSAILEKRRR